MAGHWKNYSTKQTAQKWIITITGSPKIRISLPKLGLHHNRTAPATKPQVEKLGKKLVGFFKKNT